MAADLNSVILAGRLTRDPEVRHTSAGQAVADLGLAISERYKNKAGEWVERSVFLEVVVWGRQAETCGEYLAKGSAVLIEGRLQLDQWENQQGEKRSKLLVRALRVQFLDPPPSGRSDAGDAPARETDRPAQEFHGGQDTEDVPF